MKKLEIIRKSDGEKIFVYPNSDEVDVNYVEISSHLKWAKVISGVNVRQSPSANSQKVGYLKDKEVIEISDTINEGTGHYWRQIVSGEYTGKYVAECNLTSWQYYLNIREETATILEVPYVSQLGLQARGGYDCGQASVLMLYQFYDGSHDYTVDDLSKIKPSRTTANDLVHIASRIGLELISDKDGSLENIIRKLDNGKPVICLVDYKKLPFINHLSSHKDKYGNIISGRDQGLHWFVVIGKSKNNNIVYVNDPLWLYNQNNGQGNNTGGLSLKVYSEHLKSSLSPYSIVF